MAEMNPPNSDVHPMRVLLMIPRTQPRLKQKDKWSPEFHDFLAQCFIKYPQQRPTAEQLLKVDFINSDLVPLHLLTVFLHSTHSCRIQSQKQY